MMVTKVRVFCWVLLAVVVPISCAPRSKHSKHHAPQTVYDQKQTGDYNIQLHLKDFQIIALLGEDSIGSLGDYDYNYDYSDLTVKPSTNKPTSPSPSPPPSPTTSSPVTQKPLPTLKPSNHPYPILQPNITQPPKLTPSKNSVNASAVLAAALNEVDKTEKPASAATTDMLSSTTKRNDLEELNSPGKIKVQILETPVSVVPGEETHSSNMGAPGEIVQLRRCANGYARDKRGRCRRLRKPVNGASQLPYGFGRLASNLVSRFRQAPPETSLSSSESTEK